MTLFIMTVERVLPFPQNQWRLQHDFHPVLWFHLCHQPLPFSSLFALRPELTAGSDSRLCVRACVYVRVCGMGVCLKWLKTSFTLCVVMSEHSRLTVISWNNVMPPTRPGLPGVYRSLWCDWCVPSPPSCTASFFWRLARIAHTILTY